MERYRSALTFRRQTNAYYGATAIDIELGTYSPTRILP
ncbi:hypothetical protein LINGRAPRIM_LOCUS536 [Linum grandiflorum]